MGSILVRNFVLFASCLALFQSAISFAANPTQVAQARAQAMLNEGKDIPKLEGQAKINAMLDTMRRYVDSRHIAKSALGIHYRTLSESPLLETYYSAFEQGLARFLAKSLTADFALAGFNAMNPTWHGGTYKQVEVKLQPLNGSVSGTVALEDTKGDGEYWVTDLKIESISLAINYRTTYVGVLGQNRGNLQALIDYINKN